MRAGVGILECSIDGVLHVTYGLYPVFFFRPPTSSPASSCPKVCLSKPRHVTFCEPPREPLKDSAPISPISISHRPFPSPRPQSDCALIRARTACRECPSPGTLPPHAVQPPAPRPPQPPAAAPLSQTTTPASAEALDVRARGAGKPPAACSSGMLFGSAGLLRQQVEPTSTIWTLALVFHGFLWNLGA